LRAEDVDDLTHAAVRSEPITVTRDDARTLLATVLQGMQPEIGDVGRFRMAKDSKDSTHGNDRGGRRADAGVMPLF
jgi:hypothetical protein